MLLNWLFILSAKAITLSPPLIGVLLEVGAPILPPQPPVIFQKLQVPSAGPSKVVPLPSKVVPTNVVDVPVEPTSVLAPSETKDSSQSIVGAPVLISDPQPPGKKEPSTLPATSASSTSNMVTPEGFTEPIPPIAQVSVLTAPDAQPTPQADLPGMSLTSGASVSPPTETPNAPDHSLLVILIASGCGIILLILAGFLFARYRSKRSQDHSLEDGPDFIHFKHDIFTEMASSAHITPAASVPSYMANYDAHLSIFSSASERESVAASPTYSVFVDQLARKLGVDTPLEADRENRDTVASFQSDKTVAV
jgi:hypothetical protein